MSDKYVQMKNKFLSGQLGGCESFFKKHGYSLEYGYCLIIDGDFDGAESVFEKIYEENPRARWGIVLIQMLKGYVNHNPTYFEIRNFLEIDLDIFIKYYKGEYIEKIMRYSELLSYFNLESCKYMGRVFWANNLMPAAMYFLRKAKDVFYNDPELHYLLAYIAYNTDNRTECQKALNICLNIASEYAPALNLQQKLSV